MSSRTLANWLRALACVASIAAIAACGGGGNVGSGGTGAPLGVAVGTVNGFGSVIVDGVRFDDRGAATVAEDRPGHEVLAEVKLGHRVEIEFDDTGAARTLRVEAALAGTVASVSPLVSTLVVMGQTVLVSTDAATGPVTQFGGGYTRLADVHAGDIVEVHGIVVPQGIQATRIEHEDALPPFLRATGIVSNLNGATFRLGGLTVTTGSATTLPAGTALANGQIVRVMAAPSALTGTTLAAAQVRIKKLPQDGNRAQVSGAIASLNTTVRTFLIGTQKVDYATASIVPAPGALANGKYVRVRGQLAADGTLVAIEVQVRDGLEDDAQAELHGNIGSLDTTAKRFTVRGVVVEYSTGTAFPGCPSPLTNGLFVEVAGTLSSTAVEATTVKCEDEPAGSIVERQGVATSVLAGARSFTLTPASGPALTVTWTDTTLFRDLTPATLANQPVEVEGVLSGTTLAATKVKLHH